MLVIFLATGALAVTDPQVEVENTVNSVLQVLQNSELSIVDKKLQISSQMEGFLDIESLSRGVLWSFWDGASEEQRSRFAELFLEVMEATYLNKIGDYSAGASVLYVNKRVKEDKAIIDTLIKADDLEIAVQYRMHYVSDRWQVIDVVIDEDLSMVKSFRGVYGAIIERGGYEELLTIMAERVREMSGS
jgi:phospholipid transport system substrate-binding protein